MKFKLLVLFYFIIAILSCQKNFSPIENMDNVSKADSTSLELVWEKPLDSNFQKIQIYPFPVGENIIHSYDFGLEQILIYRNGKTGDEIKRINFFSLIDTYKAIAYNETVVFGGIKSLAIIDAKTEIIQYIYTVINESGYINERFKKFSDLVFTNEYSFQPKDSIDRIIAVNLKDKTSKVLFNDKSKPGKNSLHNSHLWVDEVGDTILTVGKESKYAGSSSPSNLLSFNVSKGKILYDIELPSVNLYDDFVCFNKKIYLINASKSLICLDGKTGKFLWEFIPKLIFIGSLQLDFLDNQLIITLPNGIFNVDAEKGTLLWSNQEIKYFKDDTKFLLIDNIIYLGKDDYIYGIDKTTGVLLKKQKITKGKNLLISNLSYSEKNKLIYAIDSSFIKALRIK